MGDAATLDTAALNRTIEEASKSGGGTVLFPPGDYLTGTIELLSNVTLDLVAGAAIRGSTNVADYGNIATYAFPNVNGVNISGEGTKVGLIVARNAENVAITGQGKIDGNGDSFFDFATPHVGMDFDPQSTRNPSAFMKAVARTDDGPVWMKPANRPGTMIIFWNCSNVVMHDITLQNAPNWTLHLQGANYATLTGVRIINDLKLPNNDGIDIIRSRHVHISDCDIAAGDDGFAIFESEDVSASDCSLTSNSSGVRLESSRNSIFSNLVIHANRGVGIYERSDGETANILFSNLVINTHLIAGHWWGKGEPIFLADGGNGRVRDVRFSNVIANGESGMLLYASHPDMVRGIMLDQVKLTIHAPGSELATAFGGNFDLRWVATKLPDAVFKHDIPALYSHNIDDLKIHDFEVAWDSSLPDYFSNAIEADNFNGLIIDGFSGRQAVVDSPDAVIALSHGAGITIRNSTATFGAAQFLSMDGVTGQRLFASNDLANARPMLERELSGFTDYGNRMPPRATTPKRRRAVRVPAE